MESTQAENARKAFSYLRVSGKGQVDGDGFPRQRSVIAAYARKMGAAGEFEKSALVWKLRAARDRKRKREGRCEGRKPFGERPGESETLARIKELHRKPRNAERRSMADIADMLNQEERPTRTGRPWNPGTVWALLKREKAAPRKG